MLGGVLYLLFLFLVYMRYKSRRNYRQRKALQRQVVLVISDAGLSGQAANGFVNTPWDDFLKWKEGKTLFLLYLSDAMFQVVPKRFFPLAEDVDFFRETLKLKVPTK